MPTTPPADPRAVDGEIEANEPTYDDILAGMLVDWSTFWAIDHNETDWLAEPIIAAKRSTAIFAPGGTGKSLLALYIAGCLATGTKVFGRPVEPIDVLYLDYEMTADDLAERLTSMGFDEADLGRLHYALLPSLPGLDEPEGGKAVVRLAEMVGAQLVVIDTFGRAVHGDENDADTVRSWYRWTGLHLKHDGRAFLRVDHAGKDTSKGQRGTSAKNDDVDVVWEMRAKEAGTFTLIAKKRRMGWVPMTVDLVMTETHELRFDLANGHVWPKGTADAAKALDELGVPVECTVRQAKAAMKEAGRTGSAEAILNAVKYRKEASSIYHFTGQDPVDNAPETARHTPRHTPDDTGTAHATAHDPENTASPQVDACAVVETAHHGTPSDATTAQRATRRGARVPSVQPEPVSAPLPYADPNVF